MAGRLLSGDPRPEPKGLNNERTKALRFIRDNQVLVGSNPRPLTRTMVQRLFEDGLIERGVDFAKVSAVSFYRWQLTEKAIGMLPKERAAKADPGPGKRPGDREDSGNEGEGYPW